MQLRSLSWKTTQSFQALVLILLALAGSILLTASQAFALVVDPTTGPLPIPSNGFVGRWNGSSGVAVGPRHVLSAGHTGGGVGSQFILNGITYTAIAYQPHGVVDLGIATLDRPLPGYHRLVSRPLVYNEVVTLAGWGMTEGPLVSSGAGYPWQIPWELRWARNRLASPSNFLVTTFTSPLSPDFVPHEGGGAINDSGGGLFVQDANGNYELAGIIVSVMRSGSTYFDDPTFALNLETYKDWIQQVTGTQPTPTPTPTPQAVPTRPVLPVPTVSINPTLSPLPDRTPVSIVPVSTHRFKVTSYSEQVGQNQLFNISAAVQVNGTDISPDTLNEQCHIVVTTIEAKRRKTTLSSVLGSIQSKSRLRLKLLRVSGPKTPVKLGFILNCESFEAEAPILTIKNRKRAAATANNKWLRALQRSLNRKK